MIIGKKESQTKKEKEKNVSEFSNESRMARAIYQLIGIVFSGLK